MATITDSRLAVYECLIALAWADHVLSDSERELLHAMIEGNSSIDSKTKEQLHQDINAPTDIKLAWEKITDVEDRAFLLDAANTLFHADGEFCGDEKEIYDTLLQEHLGNIDPEWLKKDLHNIAAERKKQREAFNTELEELRTKHKDVTSKLGGFFKNMVKAG